MMNLPQHTRVIAGKKYVVTTLSTDPGRKLWFKLLKICGPALGTFLRDAGAQLLTGDGNFSLKAVSMPLAGAALTELVAGLQESDFDAFYATFLESTALELEDDKGTRRIQLESIKSVAFAGQYGIMVKWLGFCLEVNFASFFAELGLTAPLVS